MNDYIWSAAIAVAGLLGLVYSIHIMNRKEWISISSLQSYYGHNPTKTLVAALSAALCAVLVVFMSVDMLANFFGDRRCEAYADENGLEYRYSLQLGCRVKIGEQWVPKESIRYEIEDR